MPTFNYTARDRDGLQSSGTIAAKDVQEVRDTLRNRELYLTAYRQLGDATDRAIGVPEPRRKAVKLSDLVVMSRQLSTLVRAGLPIVEALHGVAAQTESPYLVYVLGQIRVDVLSGGTLSDAMARHPRVFGELYVSLVQAGEAGGVLEDTLETAAVQLDKEAEIREKVRTAMVYPALVALTTIGVVVFMLMVIVPVFARVYDQFDAQLPLITQALIALSAVLVKYTWLVALGVVVFVLAARRYVSTPKGRMRYDRLKLKLPLFGKLNRKIAISRFTRTLSGVVKAGVPILRALAISANTSGSMVIVDAVRKVVQYVKEGSSIAIPLEQTGEFPAVVTRMIAAGEQSGNLDEMLDQVTIYYDRDVEYSVAKLTRIMEPLMTVLVGGVVLFVLLALYMPVFNLTQVIRKR